jgi:hypothetical protein
VLSRAIAGRSSRRARVLDREDVRHIGVMLVDDGHPAPWPEDEPEPVVPAAFESATKNRKLGEWPDRTSEALSRIGRKAMTKGQSGQRLGRRGADDNPGHALQLVKRNSFSACDLRTGECDPLLRPWNAVQYLDHRPAVDLGVVDRPRQKGTRKRPFGCMRLFGHPLQPLSVLVVKQHVDPIRSPTSCHISQLSTIQHRSCISGGPGTRIRLSKLRLRVG